MKAIIYVISPTNSIEFPQHSMVEIFLWNDSYVTTSLSNTSNVGKSIVYGAYNKIENVWRLYYCNRSIGGYITVIGASTEAKTQVINICTLFSDFSN